MFDYIMYNLKDIGDCSPGTYYFVIVDDVASRHLMSQGVVKFKFIDTDVQSFEIDETVLAGNLFHSIL